MIMAEYANIPKRLRELADQLEAERIYIIDAVVVVNRSMGSPMVVYAGSNKDEASGAHLLLHVGARTLVDDVFRDRY